MPQASAHQPHTPAAEPFNTPPLVIVVAAAWALPGLGHVLIGEAKRGIIAGVTLIALFTSGLLIGGVGVIDSKADPVPLWFAGQTLIGPITIILNEYHQGLKASLDKQVSLHATDLRESRHGSTYDDAKLDLLTRTDPPPVYRLSIGRVNELGTLYCTLAGVLNLLLILDVVGRATGDIPATAAVRKEGEAA